MSFVTLLNLILPDAWPGWTEPYLFVVLILVLALIIITLLYRKTRADEALIRTGLGGMKIVIDGGTLVLPFFHDLKRLSLETMPLNVARNGKDAFITQDHYRADITANFYVKVLKNREDIEKASRSVGGKALNSDSIMKLVQDKLVGALRDVAATRTLQSLHDNRQNFADAVHNVLKGGMNENGLTLESVSITNLDQTNKSAYDENNVFDARGLKAITEITERARKEKFDISLNANVEAKRREEEAKVELKRVEVECEKKRLELDKEREFASVNQKKEVENFRVERDAEREKLKIEKEEIVKKREIEKEKVLLEAQIIKDQNIKAAEIAKETSLIEKQKEKEETEIQKERDIEITKRDKEISIIRKQRETELEEVKKLEATAEREKAHQMVLMVETTQKAEREKISILIQQRAQSEKEKIQKEVAADAEAYVCQRNAEAKAMASEQDAITIQKIADAELKKSENQAKGNRMLFEAKNIVSTQVLIQEAIIKLIETTPQILNEMMKPAEKISDIKVLNVNGGSQSEGANKVVTAFLQAGAAMPMLREMLKFADVDTENLSLSDVARKAIQSVPGIQKIIENVPEDIKIDKGKEKT